VAGDNRGTPKVLQNENGHVVANEQEGHKYFPLPCAYLSLRDEILDVVAKLGSANLDSDVDIIALIV
jgi:hypothetical protein